MMDLRKRADVLGWLENTAATGTAYNASYALSAIDLIKPKDTPILMIDLAPSLPGASPSYIASIVYPDGRHFHGEGKTIGLAVHRLGVHMHGRGL